MTLLLPSPNKNYLGEGAKSRHITFKGLLLVRKYAFRASFLAIDIVVAIVVVVSFNLRTNESSQLDPTIGKQPMQIFYKSKIETKSALGSAHF